MERTLVIVKPDAVQRGLIGAVLARLEQRGLRFVAMKMMQIPPELGAKHYAEHKEKPFYSRLMRLITSGPSVVAVVEANNAIKIVRDTMGDTKPNKACPGTIRADFGIDVAGNLVHGSADADAAALEIPLFFRDEEILSYKRAIDPWLSED